ncbi:unnamed protein product [Cylicocyclus nassatus]|uniref:C2H2-type domain-containing protein n=1 Tax=Cylicocyclus nassatus TaxID=53992 RepID=A0AA36GKR8_CYLNA|nr:unnamed protein product [Cylicocyclus nassatus]
MRGRILPAVDGSTVRSVSSYVQINIYDTTLKELHTRGVDIEQILQRSGCRSIIMDVPIISAELRKVTKNGRCRPRKFGSNSPVLGAKRPHSECSYVENDAVSVNYGENTRRSVVQTQSEEESMDCRENLHSTSTNADNRGPLTSTPVLSKHNYNDFFNIDISTVVPDASFKYELPTKPVDPCVYTNTDNYYEPLLVKEEPYTNEILNQFSRPIGSFEAVKQPETENVHEVNVLLDRTLHNNGFEVEDTGFQYDANEATGNGRLYDNIAKLGNVESHREPQLSKKSPMTQHKVILDLDTHKAVTDHVVADEKLTSSARSFGSGFHASSFPHANACKNSGCQNTIDPKECLETQNDSKHNSTITDKLCEEERTIKCQIPMCHKTLVYRRKYGKSRLVEHVRTHWERPVKKCKLCDFKASSARKVNYHHKFSHPNQPFTGSVSLESKEDLDELLVLWQRCFPGHKYEFPKQHVTVSINGQRSECKPL